MTNWNYRDLTLAVVALLGLALGTSTAHTQSGDRIVYSGFGGTWAEHMRTHVFDPFEREKGIAVVDEGGVNLAKIKAMVEAGSVQWDVVNVIGPWLISGTKEGLFEPLDYSLISTDGYPTGTVFENGVAVDTFSIAMAYRTDSFQDGAGPKTWADFWDVEKFPGRRAIFDAPRYMLESALLADGVPIDELYPLDVDRAFAKLDELKPHIELFLRNFEQAAQALADGTIELSITGPARLFPLIQNGAPIAVVWNGGAMSYDFLAIPKGAPNARAAMEFIAWYANNPSAQAAMAAEFPQGPVHPAGLDQLPGELRDQMPTAHLDEVYVYDIEWWAENIAAMEERWNEWKLK